MSYWRTLNILCGVFIFLRVSGLTGQHDNLERHWDLSLAQPHLCSGNVRDLGFLVHVSPHSLEAIWVYIRAGDHHKHAHCTCLDPYNADPEIGHYQLYILVCWIIHGRVLIDTSSISQQFAWLKHTVSFFEISFFPVYTWWAPSSLHFDFGTIHSGFFVPLETRNHTSNPRGFMELCWGHIKPRLRVMWFMALSCNFQGHCCAFFMQPMPGPQWYHYGKQTKEERYMYFWVKLLSWIYFKWRRQEVPFVLHKVLFKVFDCILMTQVRFVSYFHIDI